MSEGAILVIERASNKEQAFAPALERKGLVLDVVSSGRAALEILQAGTHDLIVLNAASLGTSGLRICQKLTEQPGALPIIHIFPEHTPDREAARSPANITLSLPFTPRKLINRVRRLLPQEMKDMIEVGQVRFAPRARVVRAHGKERRLTPKAAALLVLFLKHPRETLPRSFLMQEVWDTDYVGDTRTLDVHVRWIREAIEPDPTRPHHIRTVRGKGYRFEPGMDGGIGGKARDR